MASTRDWFESVNEAERRARKRLPRSVYSALIAGAERGDSSADNLSAFRELGFIPRIATGLPAERELSTTVMGVQLSMPILVSPVGVQAVHPDGEIAVGRAAAAAGIAAGLSSFGSKPLAEVSAANPATFFQTYWMGGRERITQLLDYARTNGAQGIILTLDWTFSHRRDWGSPAIRLLPGIVEVVADEVEILLDGGIRRGSDVVKALALGADAVMSGRGVLWGLAANGQTGVTNVLEILRAGIDETLVGLGHASIHDLTPEDVLVPDGFTRPIPVAR
jgi:isopentenyl diphosphate isomerase/L-lactate dehydrogenase-like FMN-dependent dehydrogenase